MAARHGHAAAYHGVRLPAYTAQTLMWSAVGVLRTGGRLLTWWHIPGTSLLESQAARDGLIHEHLRLHKAGKEARKARGIIIGLGAAAAIMGLAGLVVCSTAGGRGRYWPWWSCLPWHGPGTRRGGRSYSPRCCPPRCRRRRRTSSPGPSGRSG
jgi:hypothetical protein